MINDIIVVKNTHTSTNFHAHQLEKIRTALTYILPDL